MATETLTRLADLTLIYADLVAKGHADRDLSVFDRDLLVDILKAVGRENPGTQPEARRLAVRFGGELDARLGVIERAIEVVTNIL